MLEHQPAEEEGPPEVLKHRPAGFGCLLLPYTSYPDPFLHHPAAPGNHDQSSPGVAASIEVNALVPPGKC